jgi:hypothetical protein
MTDDSAPGSETVEPMLDELSAVLRASLLALAEAGELDQACRLAGQACRILRREQPRNWRVFNALLHRLSPRSGAVGSSRTPSLPGTPEPR